MYHKCNVVVLVLTTSTPGTGTNNNPADENTIGSTGISTDSSRPIHNRRTLEENNINNNNNSNSNNNNEVSKKYNKLKI